MCYLNHVKQCKHSAKLFLNYSNRTSIVIWFLQRMLSKTQTTHLYVLNHGTHKQLMLSVLLNVSIVH